MGLENKKRMCTMIEKQLKEEQKIQIGGIYPLCEDIEDNEEKLCEGTPLKVISILDDNYNLKCEDYRGVKHYLHHSYLYSNRIETYPSHFKVTMMKIRNFIGDEHIKALILAISIFIFFFALIGMLFFTFIMSYTGRSTFTNSEQIFIYCCIGISLFLFMIIIAVRDIECNPVYTKENLKELKILFNKKGAKTGSEAAQKIKEKYTR